MTTTGRLQVSPDEIAHLKQERAIRTRGVILDAAAAAFAEEGFPNVTIKNIADRAEMTKGAVYFHFANKEALAVAVAEHFYRRLRAVVAPSLDGCTPDAVREVLLRVAAAFRDDHVIQAGARLQIERAYIKAELPTPYVDFTDRITEILRRCQDAGTLPASGDPETLARVLRSALFGAQHISWVTSERADIVERVREITDAVLPAA
jgi:AcrR family transcriptional regulator